MIAYKFRMYPDKTQQQKLWEHANKLNKLYNYFLNLKIEKYKDNKESLSRFTLQAMLPNLKEEDPELKEIHSQILQGVVKRLDLSYQSFFRRVKNKEVAGFPKFRPCRNFFGIHYPQSGYTINNNKIKTKAYGELHFVKHREIKGNIKSINITCKNDQWFVSILSDCEKEKIKNDISIGIDVGITNLVALSNGVIIKNKQHAKYYDKQIGKLQNRKSKCKKGSRKYKRFGQVITRLYGAKCRKINDFQHKVSKNLSTKYDTIIVEDLQIKQMTEGKIRGLNREMRNSSIGNFINKLSYKCNRLVKVNPRNTSKTCSNCGKIQDMPLHKRTYLCDCGYENDRDVNAAINIHCLGQAIISGLCSANANLQEAFVFMQK